MAVNRIPHVSGHRTRDCLDRGGLAGPRPEAPKRHRISATLCSTLRLDDTGTLSVSQSAESAVPALPRDPDGFRVEINPARERADVVLDRPPLNVVTISGILSFPMPNNFRNLLIHGYPIPMSSIRMSPAPERASTPAFNHPWTDRLHEEQCTVSGHQPHGRRAHASSNCLRISEVESGQIDRGEPDPMPLDDGGFVNALPHRRMQEQPFGTIRKAISAAGLGPQASVDLVQVAAVQRLGPMPAGPQYGVELLIDHDPAAGTSSALVCLHAADARRPRLR